MPKYERAHREDRLDRYRRRLLKKLRAAFGFQVAATGGKSATTGTTFTIALTSTAGDAVFVVVANTITGTTVSLIQDAASPSSNVYVKVNSQVNGTGIKCELWRTQSLTPLATGGTITVTMSATGNRASGVAASYRTVAALQASVLGTGATSPITSGSVALASPGGWLIFGGALGGANAFTQQNGQIRGQLTEIGVAAILIDSNGAATPVTDSATMTAASWAAVWVEIDPLPVEDDSYNNNLLIQNSSEPIVSVW